MLYIGVDPHKSLHVAVAVDDAGREIGAWSGGNRPASWLELLHWAVLLGEQRCWGVEGAWSFGRGLSQLLVRSGECVYDINPRWTAAGRRQARKRGKTDRLDARAVAVILRQEAPSLTPLTGEDETTVLELLSQERDGALAESTRLRNQAHALLLRLDPEYKSRAPSLTSRSGIEWLTTLEPSSDSVLEGQVAASVRRLGERLRLATAQADDLAAEIREHAATRYVPLTRICGVSLLTAGALAGILGPGRRFASDAQLAAYAGVAPLEASSAGQSRHRLNRGGNRRLNAILYRIVLTQAHFSTEARGYLARRREEGKTRRESVRALKRFVIRAIWRL
jgi:transposase